MTDVTSQHVVNLFNAYIRNPLNSGISWGSGNYPPDYNGYARSTYESYFTGSKNGLYNSPSTSDFSGNIDSSTMRSRIVAHAALYTAIRRVSVYMRYNNNSRYYVFANETRIGHLHSGYRTGISDPGGSGTAAGNPVDYGDLRSYMTAVKNKVVNVRNSTVSISETFCHSSCHYSCHSSCHGDGPGNGGGV